VAILQRSNMMATEKMVTVRTVCPCGVLIKENEVPESKVPLKEQRVSHGICKKCMAEQMEKLDKMAPSKFSKK